MTEQADDTPADAEALCRVDGHDWLPPHEVGFWMGGVFRLLALHRCCARCYFEERVDG